MPKFIIFLILLVVTVHISHQQKLDDIYIKFDPSQDSIQIFGDFTRFVLADHHRLPLHSRHQLDDFRYDKTKYKAYEAKYYDLSGKLKSGLQAMDLVERIRKQKSGRFSTPLYYNSYFSHVYIVKPIDNTTATVYEVDWKWSHK